MNIFTFLESQKRFQSQTVKEMKLQALEPTQPHIPVGEAQSALFLHGGPLLCFTLEHKAWDIKDKDEQGHTDQ